MQNLKTLILLTVVCPIINGYAQTSTEKRSLVIGDSVPNIEYSNVLNYDQSSIRLSDFNGKLIILDFWSTWCTACHAWFEKADSLQEQFADKIQFILVNSIDGTLDSAKKVRTFFDKWNNKHGFPFRLPTPVEDTISRRLFPRDYLPHYVWIWEGKLIATTSPKDVTAENICAILNGLPITITERKRKDSK
jgi:thiol-disulfide isomerase/thioredoxin